MYSDEIDTIVYQTTKIATIADSSAPHNYYSNTRSQVEAGHLCNSHPEFKNVLYYNSVRVVIYIIHNNEKSLKYCLRNAPYSVIKLVRSLA